jgi:oxygen-independent coproporphyrinogen-3 oxidase
MAGIYIHVPFCKRKCYYCDFYSTANVAQIDGFITAVKKEMELRTGYLLNENIQSIYFGGGTPSLLSLSQIDFLIRTFRAYFQISPFAEITFECNPDDVSPNYFTGLKEIGINRISLGIQSFDDEILMFLNRRHDSKKAVDAVKWARDAGFENISIDLIFGIPGMSHENYEFSLLKAINLDVEHLSAYSLSIEKGTVLYKKVNKGIVKSVDEETSLHQFDLTIEKLEANSYKHYEVSNYALKGFESKHNWLYWTNGKYIGLGPSAHSYDGKSRQWNFNNTEKYIAAINNGSDFFERENLSEMDLYNEYVLTSLRTCKGISEDYIKSYFDNKFYKHFLKVLNSFNNEGYFVNYDEEKWALNKKGIFIMDYIIRKFSFI